jgi:pyridoxine 5-phosphate synthase
VIKLFINVDHVATVRQARLHVEPDPVQAAVLAELGGADGITIHLREDRRHIQDRDVALLRATIKTPLNFEMAPTDEMVEIVTDLGPAQATLVPERREEVTTEGGLRVDSLRDELPKTVERIQQAGIFVACFVDPQPESIKASREIGADAIEINTGRYSELAGVEEREEELEWIREAADLAASLGLAVHAGHGLTYKNVGPITQVPHVEELNIGHNVVARAIFVGMERAVREMAEAIRLAEAEVRHLR